MLYPDDKLPGHIINKIHQKSKQYVEKTIVPNLIKHAVIELQHKVSTLNSKIFTASKVSDGHKAFFEKFVQYINKLDSTKISVQQYSKLDSLVKTVKHTCELDEQTLQSHLRRNREYFNYLIENIARDFKDYLSDETLETRMKALIELADFPESEKIYSWLDKDSGARSFANKYVKALNKEKYPGLGLNALMHYDSFQIGTQRLLSEVREVEKKHLEKIFNKLDDIKDPIVDDLKNKLKAYHDTLSPTQQHYTQ